jgi:hypothetical protein
LVTDDGYPGFLFVETMWFLLLRHSNLWSNPTGIFWTSGIRPKTSGGTVRIIDSIIFPAASTIAVGIMKVETGGLRKLLL